MGKSVGSHCCSASQLVVMANVIGWLTLLLTAHAIERRWYPGQIPGCSDDWPQGHYVDAYSTNHTLTTSVFDQDKLLYTIPHRYNPQASGCDRGFRVALNAHAPHTGNTYSKYAYHRSPDQASSLWICAVTFNASTPDVAVSDTHYTSANVSHRGCGRGDFPWSRLTPVAP